MKYFVAHIIRGEAGKYHKEISSILAKEFNKKPISEKLPPHLTLKAPFETDESIHQIEEIVEYFVKKQKPLPFFLEGFGDFHERVLYMDIKAPIESKKVLTELTLELKKLAWLPFEMYDWENLHATLAYAETPEQMKKMKEMIKDAGRSFHLFIDTISIMKKTDGKWQIHKEYALGSY
jgi:2'-5' RNA ligase